MLSFPVYFPCPFESFVLPARISPALSKSPLPPFLATLPKSPPITPFFATLTISLDFKSFPCHTSEKTGGTPFNLLTRIQSPFLFRRLTLSTSADSINLLPADSFFIAQYQPRGGGFP